MKKYVLNANANKKFYDESGESLNFNSDNNDTFIYNQAK